MEDVTAGAVDAQIRPARDDDEPVMSELEHASAVHHAAVDPERWRVPSREEVAESRRRRRARQPRDGALVAEVDGQVVGVIELWLRDPDDPGGARIPERHVDFGISVAEGLRGRGIGTALLRAAEAWARQRGAARMTMDLDAANAGALRLYERLGYAVFGLLMDRKLEPAPATGAESADAADPPAEAASAGAGAEGLPTLAGEQVVLRPLVEGDREALLEVLSDPTVVEVWDTRGPDTSAAELLAGEPGWLVFAIEVDGRLAGSIQASEELDPDYRHAGIDIFLSAPFQGRGIGTDAIRTLARWLLEVRGHHRLTIDPAASNERAIRAYEKVGFQRVGVMRLYERGQDGAFHDGLLMDMLAGELR